MLVRHSLLSLFTLSIINPQKKLHLHLKSITDQKSFQLSSMFYHVNLKCSKFNQLLRIEELLGENAKYPQNFDSWKNFH